MDCQLVEVKKEEAFQRNGWNPDYLAGYLTLADVDCCEIQFSADAELGVAMV
jgi:hypothetical protein